MPGLAGASARAFASTFLISAAVLDVFHSRMYAIHRINGSSMAPSLNPQYQATGCRDWVVFRNNLRIMADYQEFGGSGAPSRLTRGMIVSFRNPLTGRLAIKRVVALHGDRVKPLKRNGRLVLGLEPMEEGELTVPFGHVWVEGDQVDRHKTLDSNDYGPISKSLIEGVATRVIIPRSRSGPLSSNGEWEERCCSRITRIQAADMVPEEWQIV